MKTTIGTPNPLHMTILCSDRSTQRFYGPPSKRNIQQSRAKKKINIPIKSCSSILKHDGFMDKSRTRMHPSSDARTTLSEVHQSTSRIRKFTFLPLLKLLTICTWKSYFSFLAGSPSHSVKLCHMPMRQNTEFAIKGEVSHKSF